MKAFKSIVTQFQKALLKFIYNIKYEIMKIKHIKKNYIKLKKTN